MQESKDPKAGGRAQGAAGASEREATSSETLGDLEETQKVRGQKTGAAGGGERSSVPAPDGAPEPGGRGRADGSDTGGPM